jgi:hypothetical protein
MSLGLFSRFLWPSKPYQRLIMTAASSNQEYSRSLRDTRVQKFILIELLVLLAFSLCTSLLFHLSKFNIWALSRTTMPSDNRPLSTGNKINAADVWFALFTTISTDAFYVAITLNRTLMKNWHYFVSLRLMAASSLIYFLIYVYGKDTASSSVYQHMATLLALLGLYLAFGRILQLLHKPPPATLVNARFGSIQSYTKSMYRSTSGWKSALYNASIIGIIPLVLTVVMVPAWATTIPLAAIGFEVRILAHIVFLQMSLTRRFT